MRHVYSVLAAVVVTAAARPAPASDMPYGADALPFLARHASVVIEAGPEVTVKQEPSRRRSKADSARAAVYEVITRSVLKGEVKIEAPVRVVFPLGTEVASSKELADSIIFLSGSLNKEEVEQWNIPPGENNHLVVSGRFGVLPAGDFRLSEERLKAVKEYLAPFPEKATPHEKAERRLSWAKAYLNNKDIFLQRSAVLEAGDQVNTLPKQSIVLLSEALSSSRVLTANKLSVIHGLGASDYGPALQPLMDYAKNKNAPDILRLSAVQAVAGLPGGRQRIRDLKELNDPLISPKAKEIEEKLTARQRAKEAMTLERENLLREGLRSDDRVKRREAIAQTEKYALSEGLVAELMKRVLDGKEDSVLRIKAVDALGDANNDGAARALQGIALEKDIPSVIRNSAVLAVSNMDARLAQPVLKRLAEKLEGSDTGALAAGLVSGEK